MPTGSLLPRLRGATVGGLSALTAVTAHAQGHGELPGTSGLLLVLTVAVGLGLAVGGTDRAASPIVGTARLLTALVGGQVLIHLMLIMLAGTHHDLFTGPMFAMHTAGVVVALGILAGLDVLSVAFGAIAARIVALVVATPIPEPTTPALPVAAAQRPHALVRLDTRGTRGPPLFV